MYFVLAFVLVSVCTQLDVVSGGKILAVLPTPSYSHHVLYVGLLKELNKRGHEIVVFTPNPFNDKSMKNYTEISLLHLYDTIKDLDFTKLRFDKNWIESINLIWEHSYKGCHYVLSNPALKKLYEHGNTHKFDLLLIEYLFYPSIYGLTHKLGIPYIGITSIGLLQYDEYNLGMNVLPSHLSNWELGNGLGINVPFFQRLKNFVNTWNFIYRSDSEFMSKQNEIAKYYFGDELPDIREISKNVSVILANFHDVFSHMKPKVAKIIDIGGILMSYENNTQQLSKDMKSFLDDATKGFIYMSLGTNAKSNALPAHVKQAFVKVFSKLPYKVLWKYEDDSLPNIAKNIYLSKWLPQRAVLGHPNIKLFIYQGGLQSSEEAIAYGVPLVGIPMLADQSSQVAKMVSIGVAQHLDIIDINEHNFLQAINEVMHNKRYKENMLYARKIYKEMSRGRLERAVWWTEFVMRHGEAPYLDFSIADEPWYTKYDLDVIFCLSVLIFIVSCIILYAFIKIILRIRKFTDHCAQKKMKVN